MSVRVQVTLPDDVARELKREAAKRKMPVSEVVKEKLSDRAPHRRKSKADNPFAAITGLLKGEDRDLAARVDEVLYR
jgi:hypothetical protein